MTWPGIVWTPELVAEDAERRRRDTFGGYVWPELTVKILTPQKPVRRDEPMSGREVVGEAVWLLDGGVHPLMVAVQLDRSVAALERLFRRYEPAGAHLFGRYAKWERRAA